MPKPPPNTELDEVFAREMLPHKDALTAFAFRLSEDPDEAADLVQNAYLKAYRFIGGYEPGTNAKAWLFRILKNGFVNEYRRRQKLPPAVDYDEVIVLAERDGGNVPVYVDLRVELFEELLGDEVTRAINGLPVNFRLVLLLADVEGFTYEEIARITDVPIGTVRSRLHRARGVLKEKLGDYAKTWGIGKG